MALSSKLFLAGHFAAVALACAPCAPAAMRSFAPGVEVAGASNPAAVLFSDWTGDGHDELATIDMIRRDLTLRSVSTPWGWYSLPSVLATDLQIPFNLFRRDADGDEVPDLVLADAGRIRIWKGKARNGLSAQPPDIDFALPMPPGIVAEVTAAEDFDGDGKVDLLVRMYDPVAYDEGSTYQVVFSFASQDRAIFPFPIAARGSDVTVAPQWEAGGGPSLLEAAPSAIVHRFARDRSLMPPVRTPSLPGPGLLMDTDGVAPPEYIATEFQYLETPQGWKRDNSLKIYSWSGGSWVLRQTCAVNSVMVDWPYGFLGDLPVYNRAIGDFDGNGSQDLALMVKGIDSAGNSGVFMLERDPGSGLYSVRVVPWSGKGPDRLGVVRAPDSGRDLLAFTGALGPCLDIFGNPVSFYEAGWQIRVRTSATSSGLPPEVDIPNRLSIGRAALAQMGGTPTPDLALVATDPVASTTFHPGGRTSPFSTAPVYHPVQYDFPASAESLVLDDLTGDGRAEMVTEDGAGNILVYQTHPDGHYDSNGTGFLLSRLSSFRAAASAAGPTRVIGAGDFDGNGQRDILYLRGDDETLCWATHQAGAYSSPRSIALCGRWWKQAPFSGYQWVGAGQTVITDTDGDGKEEILTYPSAFGNRITMYRHTSVGFGMAPVSGEITGLSDPLLLKGRFSNDATSPIQLVVAGLWEKQVACFTGNAAGLVEGGRTTLPPGTACMIATDINDDGLDDLVVAQTAVEDTFGNPVGSSLLQWMRCKGDGTFGPPVTIAVPSGFASQLLAGDITGDGLEDLVVISRTAASVIVFEAQETAGIPPYAEWCNQWGLADSPLLADPDGDGIPNLVEYASGTAPDGSGSTAPPWNGPSIKPYVNVGSRGVQAAHPRPRIAGGGRIDVVLEFSNDLKTWAPYPGEPVYYTDPANPDWEQVTWYTYPPQSVEFFRFRITYVP